jgi:hypothetical protein
MKRLIPLMFLAGCVAAGGGGGGGEGSTDPVSARLSAEGLSVRLANGTTCRGGRPPPGAPRWQGALAGCPEGWSYFVELDRRSNPARLIVETVLTALTIEDALAPFATVTVVDAAGQATVFASPPA